MRVAELAVGGVWVGNAAWLVALRGGRPLATPFLVLSGDGARPFFGIGVPTCSVSHFSLGDPSKPSSDWCSSAGPVDLRARAGMRDGGALARGLGGE